MLEAPGIPSAFGPDETHEAGPILYCPACSSRPGAKVACVLCGRQTTIPADKGAVRYQCANCGGELARRSQTTCMTKRQEAPAGFEPFAIVERWYHCAAQLPPGLGGGRCGLELEYRRFKVPVGAPTPGPL